MSRFQEILIEALTETDQNLEEGKFGKFLGTMATAAALGLGGMTGYTPNAVAGTYQNQEQILRSQFDQPAPDWIENAGELFMKDGKISFTNEIVKDSNANNTSMLTRMSGAGASVKMLQKLSSLVNANLGNANKIGTNFNISGLTPKKNYWALLDTKDGKEYHAYSLVQIDQENMVKALTNAIKKANPSMNQSKINSIVQNAIQSISIGN